MRNKKKLSIKYTMYLSFALIASFLLAAGIVIAVVAIFNFVGKDYVQNNILPFLAICFGSAVIVGWILSTIISREVIKSEIYLHEVLEAIANGDYTKTIPGSKTNELLEDARVDFNKMVDKLNSTVLLQKDFASNFSHEFKTPIASIKGYAEVLKNDDTLSEKQRAKYLDIIIDESDRLVNLASSTLLMSKLDSEQYLENVKSVNIRNQLEESVILLDKSFEQKNIEVEMNTLPVTVKGNPDMLKEVWINVITNAIRYNVPNGKVMIRSYYEGQSATVSITDTGVGMDEDTVARIFDKYYQSRREESKNGSGLGMSIVKRIVELSGGTIGVESKPGEGSTVTVRLPKA